MDKEFLLKTIEDLMKSHDELMAGIGGIVVDYALLNECRINGDKAIRQLKQELEFGLEEEAEQGYDDYL